MPATKTYPGIYVEELASGVRTITGVSTSNGAFVDVFSRGPLDTPTEVTSYDDFARTFGGFDQRSEASYAVYQFFLNGGQLAWIVRVDGGEPTPTPVTVPEGYYPTGYYGYGYGGGPGQPMRVHAANPGVWGFGVQFAVDYKTSDPSDDTLFNLVVREVGVDDRGNPAVVGSEVFRNLSRDSAATRYAPSVVNRESNLVQIDLDLGMRPAATGADVTADAAIRDVNSGAFLYIQPGFVPSSPGTTPDATALVAGLNALRNIAPGIFNIVCVPAAANLQPGALQTVVQTATALCRDRRAFLIVDVPPDVKTLEQMQTWMGANDTLRDRNAAVYFPRVEMPDPLNEYRPRPVGASGTLAGIYARTDSGRGVWKAPAGTEATLSGVTVPLKLNDEQNGLLNPEGINVLRTFPIFGSVSWGARTLEGADVQASEWKYVPVRRTALFIEESLAEGLTWVVFEPNDEPLWAQIRLNVGAFMHDLFRQGAFQGRTPREAYFVKCDSTTTTQTDIDHGIVNILVGFAPLKPAEFVVIRIQQIAGQIET
jgi:phage tail sheath protein FI